MKTADNFNRIGGILQRVAREISGSEMKTAEAEVLASSLSQEQLRVFRVICGKADTASEVDSAALVVLCELGLVKRAVSIEEAPRELVLLTQKGKKVEKFV